MYMVNLQTMQQMVYFNKVTLTFCKTVVQFSIDNYINTSGATSGAGTAYPSGAHNTMTKRKRTDNTMTKRKRTDNTMTKRKRTNNQLQNKHIKLKIE
jgi:hypothetical protein